jgi:tripartite-type tricarboxylate transporter receptor subunit TctC
MKIALRALTLLILGALHISSAVAQPYPSRPIQIVVPSPPGGNIDTLARQLASGLSTGLGQPVVVSNRAGASMIIGTEYVSKAAPDGYTLLMASSTALAMNPVMFAKLPYHPLKSLSPVSLVATQPMVIIVHPSVPAQSLQELVQLAKAKPGSLFYGATGSSIHLATEYFNRSLGISMEPVRYKGNSEGLIDLIAGRIQVLFDVLTTSKKFVDSGQARALAITSLERTSAAPKIPTVAETVLPGFEVNLFFALLAPPGTPEAVVTRLNTEVATVLRSTAIREQMANLGVEPAAGPPEKLLEHMKAEIERWQTVAREAKIEPQN